MDKKRNRFPTARESQLASQILFKVRNNVGAVLRLPIGDMDVLTDDDRITGEEMDLIRSLLRPLKRTQSLK